MQRVDEQRKLILTTRPRLLTAPGSIFETEILSGAIYRTQHGVQGC